MGCDPKIGDYNIQAKEIYLMTFDFCKKSPSQVQTKVTTVSTTIVFMGYMLLFAQSA